MSPAVVDFRSPVNSPQPKPTSLQNPSSHMPSHSFSPFSSGSYFLDNQSENMNSSIIDNASKVSFGIGSSSTPAVSRTSTAKPPVSASGRSKPRMNKTRRQLKSQHVRSRTSSNDVVLGFNPFHSGLESSNEANDGNDSSNLSNDYNISLDDNTSNKCGNMDFVFGANRSGFSVNLDSEKSGTSDSVDELGCEGNGKIDNEGNREFDNLGFVFGATASHQPDNANVEKRESSKKLGYFCDADNGKLNIDIVEESGKFDYPEFVFAANNSGLEINLSLDNGDFSDSDKKTGPLEGNKVNVQSERQCGKDKNIGFMVADNHSNMACTSNSEKINVSERVGKLFVDDTLKMAVEIEAKEKKCENLNFVFGSSWINSVSNTNMVNLEAESETEFHKLKAGGVCFDAKEEIGKGVFVFGESSNQSSGFNEGVAVNPSVTDEVNKLSSESFENCNGIDNALKHDSGSDPGIAKTESICVDSGANDKGNFAVGGSSSVASACTVPIFELPNEMRKLNINDFGKVDVASNFKGSGMTPTADSEELFVFGCYSKASGSSTEGLVTPSQIDNLDLNGPKNSDAVKKATGFGFQSNKHDSEASSMDGVEIKDECSFTGTSNESGTPFLDFRTLKLDPSCFKENLFPELNKKLEFSAKSRSAKSRRPKKKERKFRQPNLAETSIGQDFVLKESTCQEDPDCPGSPMDFSPYQEAVAAEQCSRDTSVMSTESSYMKQDCAPSGGHSTALTDAKDCVVAASKGFDVNKGDTNCSETIIKGSGYHCGKEYASGAENAHIETNAEQVSSSSCSGVASTEARAALTSVKESEEIDSERKFSLASGFDMSGKSFTFSASPDAQRNISTTKRRNRNKNRTKVGQSSDTFIITPRSQVETAPSSFQFSPHASSSSHLMHSQKGDPSSSQSKEETEKEQVKKGSISASASKWEACEKWRLRGNQAYKEQDLSKAEEFYTHGIKSVLPSDKSGCWLEPLVLCYSNRAATRMSLGRVREALGDCMRAAALDPNFSKVLIRAANCHLLLGDVKNAIQNYGKCLKSGTDVCLDRRIVIQASDGIQKAQKVAASTEKCTELLQQRIPDAACSALTVIEEALSISPYSEKILKMKAEALCMLQKYEEVIQLCERTLNFAEKNCLSLAVGDELATGMNHECKNKPFVSLWRQHLMSKSYFYMGRLELALELLEKQEHLDSSIDKCENANPESPVPLAVTIRELLLNKNAGNEAFQSGKHAEALEHYTAAISSNIESRPFAAVCSCNRAAAHQALGQIADAIAGCSLAMALDGNYPKAVSRRATLHEMIRDYGQAASDLQRYISILEKQSHENSKKSGTAEGWDASVKELRQARRRLSSMEEQAKKDVPLDLYLILGVKSSDAASEIKKAYRKAALRHHPDKAGQFLARSETGDDGRLWKEIGEEVHKDADRLFKMIGEAYAILSDPTKQSEYDLEEEIRTARKESNSNKSSPFRRQSDVHGYPFERSDRRRYWQETWRTHGNSTRW